MTDFELLWIIEKLSKKLDIPVIGVSGRTRDGVDALKEKLKEIEDKYAAMNN